MLAQLSLRPYAKRQPATARARLRRAFPATPDAIEDNPPP